MHFISYSLVQSEREDKMLKLDNFKID